MSAHTVTITKAPDNEQDDLEFTIDSCGGGDCTLWRECAGCKDRTPTHAEVDACEYTDHGERHLNIDGMWMTETGSCALAETDSGAQGMCEIAATAGTGTHQVDCGYWGDGHWDVTLVSPKDP